MSQARSVLLPQINGRMSLNKNDSDGTLNNNTTFSSSSTQQQNSASLSQSIYNYGNYARLSGSKARALQSAQDGCELRRRRIHTCNGHE